MILDSIQVRGELSQVLSGLRVALLLTILVSGLPARSDAPSLPAGHDSASASNAAADVAVFKTPDGTLVASRFDMHDVVATGSDAADVIQAAIDSLPQTGGKVFIHAGTYDLNKTIKIENKHGVHLTGAARGIVFSGGKGGTCLRSEQPIDLLHIHGGKVKAAGVTVSDLHLIGSGKDNGKAGILITGRTDLLSLHQVGVNHCGIGFYIKGGGPTGGVVDAPQIQFCDPQVNGIGLKVEHSHYPKIVGGEFSDCDEYGIVLSSPDPNHGRCMSAKVIGITAVRNGAGGILVGSNTDCTTVTGGCDFGGSPQGSGIIIANDQGGSDPQNVIVSNVHAYNNKHAGISVRQGRHVIIGQCICSGHDHIGVRRAQGQGCGIEVGAAVEDIALQEILSYGNDNPDVLATSTIDDTRLEDLTTNPPR